jgi:putative copper export protein
VLAPALDGLRLTLHVLAAAVWVGGQLTVAGLLGTVRQLGGDAPRKVARAFNSVSWPAYAVLLGTGVWNVIAVGGHQRSAWKVVLAAKIAVALVAGIAAWLHSRSRTPAGLAVWGAFAGTASVAALVMGVFLAG